MAVPATTATAQDTNTGASPQAQHENRHGHSGHAQRGGHGPRQELQPIDTTGITTMRREKNVYIINTTKLGYDARGYRGPTPLELRIQKNKIVSVKALRNNETPKYFERVQAEMLPKYEGRSVNEAQTMEVDAVTGATFSSKAVSENVRRALNFYKKNH